MPDLQPWPISSHGMLEKSGAQKLSPFIAEWFTEFEDFARATFELAEQSVSKYTVSEDIERTGNQS